VAALLAIALIASAAGCSGSSSPKGVRVDIRERDFNMTASTARVPAGWVTFQIHNSGPSTHEFNLDRTAVAPDGLPLQANAEQVNEDSTRLHRIASIGQVRLGSTDDLSVRLTPGRYVIYCNFEGHYLGGMYVGLEVTA
jgi:uncharacterized cupredoxin-like copper-binding protein